MNAAYLRGFPVNVDSKSLTYGADGKAYYTVTLCVPYPLSKEKKEELQGKGLPTADFPTIKFFGKPAETVANHIFNTKEIIIEGAKIGTSSYQSEGKMKYETSIIVNSYSDYSLIFKDSKETPKEPAPAE